MRRLLWTLFQIPVFLALMNSPAAAQATNALVPSGKTEIPFQFVSRSTDAVWSAGTLLELEDRFSSAPIFRTWDRGGKLLSQIAFTFPSAYHINIYGNSFTHGADGSLAIIGSADTNDAGEILFLACVPPDGQEQTIVRLSNFFPHAVTTAADGTIWVVGANRLAQDGPVQNLIRRYDKTGTLLGSFFLSSTSRTVPPVVRSVLVSSKDRVGWYSPISHKYVEFSLDGTVVSRVATPPTESDAIFGAALCDDGSMFAATPRPFSDGKPASWGILSLARDSGQWSFISMNETQAQGRLFGCDGTSLAVTTDGRTISWLNPTQ
jgi:hypothetical protein